MTLEAVFGTDDYRRDPGGRLHDLREAGPVHRVALPGIPPVYLVTRFQEARTAFADPRLRKDRARVPAAGSPGPETIWVSGRQLLSTDGQDHTRLRRLLNGWWSRAASAGWPAIIERHVDGLLDDLAAGPAEVDLVTAFTRPLPMRILAEIVGIPQAETPHLQELVHVITGSGTTGCPRLRAASADLTQIWFRLAKDHAGEDTLLGMLGKARQDREITLVELTSLLNMLLVAGAHSMSMFFPRAVLLLSAPPAADAGSGYCGGAELAAMLAGDDATAHEAVAEELIRLCAPFPLASHRYATDDLDLWGTPVPAGALVMPAVAAANRDPRAYADPDQACPGRRQGEPRHLSFGHGPHYCLGATLARQQARIALVGLYQRFPRLSTAGEATWRNDIIPEPTSLPVRLNRAEFRNAT
ncbi:cytochrome P450 [Actinoplanes sp. HUAS TT8]|uniref:cytochrome P450 n=1 Tax=Actinoplanes sp. HUAS TT8 TaxID=3447453 RepID=UPI003F524073